MKILYLLTQSDFGGAQRYVFDLADSLKTRHKITVAGGPSQSEELFRKLAEASQSAEKIDFVKLKYLRRAINPFFDCLGFWEIIKLIKKIKPDVIHLNSSKAGFLGSLAGKLRGVKKIIYTVHGFVFLEPMNPLKKRLYILIEKISARWKDCLITVSENDRQVGIKYRIAQPKKMITIRNGIDFEKTNFLARQSTSLTVGSLANYYPAKGLAYLIDSATTIVKEFPKISFRLMGDGPERKKLEQRIKGLGLEKHFSLGYQENASQHLKDLDIFVLPSVKEGLPYAIMEAMTAGLPIVATSVGGIAEMIKDNWNGLLVEPKNPEALAKAIIGLLKDSSLRQRLGQNALTAVKEQFSLARMVKATEKIY